MQHSKALLFPTDRKTPQRDRFSSSVYIQRQPRSRLLLSGLVAIRIDLERPWSKQQISTCWKHNFYRTLLVGDVTSHHWEYKQTNSRPPSMKLAGFDVASWSRGSHPYSNPGNSIGTVTANLRRQSTQVLSAIKYRCCKEDINHSNLLELGAFNTSLNIVGDF